MLWCLSCRDDYTKQTDKVLFVLQISRVIRTRAYLSLGFLTKWDWV